MNNYFCIYVFSDEDFIPRYVGKTKNFQQRIKEHLNRDRFKYDTWFYRWLNKQIANDKQYFIDILEEVNSDNWQERETYWINHIKENNFPLTNMTDGGDGNNNQFFSEESRKRRSEKMMGHKVSEEIRKKISEKHKGKKISQETRIKLSKFNKGKPCPESTKLKFSKKIDQYNLNNVFVQDFKSLLEASEYLKCRKSTLSNAIIRNKNGRFKNFLWRYKCEKVL